ncbi:MAG: hypothetical protein ACQERJ_00070 [Bacillota bacterium]
MNIKKRFTVGTILCFLLIAVLFTTPLKAQDKDNDLSFDQVKAPTKISDFLDVFTKFKFSIVEKRDGELIAENQITIDHHGKEKIKGVETDKVTVLGEKETGIPLIKLWVKRDSNEFKKIIINDQQVPVATAGNMVDNLLKSAFHPFLYFKQSKLSEYQDYESSNMETSTRVLGGKEVEVNKIEINKPSAYGLESGVVSIANFDDFSLLSSYEVLTLEKRKINYTIEEVKFK